MLLRATEPVVHQMIPNWASSCNSRWLNASQGQITVISVPSPSMPGMSSPNPFTPFLGGLLLNWRVCLCLNLGGPLRGVVGPWFEAGGAKVVLSLILMSLGVWWFSFRFLWAGIKDGQSGQGSGSFVHAMDLILIPHWNVLHKAAFSIFVHFCDLKT